MAKRAYMTYEDRCILEQMLKSGVSITKTAEMMDRSRSTIYNEFARAGMDSSNYDALKAQEILFAAQTGKLPLPSSGKADPDSLAHVPEPACGNRKDSLNAG